MEPGEIIRRRREELGWSQAQLGNRVGISQPAIKKIDRKATAKVKLSSARLESRRECLLDFCVSNLDVQDKVVEFDFPGRSAWLPRS